MMLSAGISILVALGWSVPLGALLARSVLTPLREVLKASERIKIADFGTPVPELWSDEFAVIARSLNEAMTGLADRERLAEDNQALLADVQASRVRIVKASDEARRRVERDLHDGAQQRLVALLVGLKTLADSCEELSQSEIAQTLEDLAAELKKALSSYASWPAVFIRLSCPLRESALRFESFPTDKHPRLDRVLH